MGDTSVHMLGAPRYGAMTPNIIATSDQKDTFFEGHDQHQPEMHPHSAPFYTQAGSLPIHYQRTGLPPMPSYSAFEHSPQRLDMRPLGHALPDPVQSAPSPSYSNHGRPYSGQQMHPMRIQYSPGRFQPPTFRHHSSSGGSETPSSAQRPEWGPQQSPFPQQSPYHGYGPQMFVPSPDGQGMGGLPASFPSSYGPVMPLPAGSHMGQFAGIDPRAYFLGPQAVSPQGADFMGHGATASYARRMSESGPTPSYPRGPPRKPKQSGHALWVGNLPPGTNVMDLKDHFSRDATNDIESLFLISKSNCAFVNYRSESACSAAMTRFHDSRFHGVRLVCRLRRRSTGAGASSQNATLASPDAPETESESPQKDRSADPDGIPARLAGGETNGNNVDGASDKEGAVQSPGPPAGKVPEKYFIVKSLTMQDLDASVRNGIWATQSHNEETLNTGFENADNVYLIFSANKSGEYFGYARMKSPIQAGSAKAPPSSGPVAPEPSEVTDGPKSIPTAATEWAPSGRVIDDSARGTIFWEADHSEENETETTTSASESQEDVRKGNQDWGKPFQIEWLSTNRLPFYRTRGLRNPWNANREVKIARDGTELEPSIGKRLVQMFHRPGPPQVMPMPGVGAGGMMAGLAHSLPGPHVVDGAGMYGHRYS